MLAALLAVASGVQAAEGAEAHGPSWTMLGWHVVNFGFLLFLLHRYARKPILDFLAQRSQGIREQIRDAEQRLDAAEAEVASLRARLRDFESEAQGIVTAATEQAEFERARALERASETAQRIREDAQRARQELRDEAADLATTLAAEILRERLTPDDDKRLVGEFVDRIRESR